MEKQHATTHHLSSLNVLFTDAWGMFKGSALNLFILSVITIVIYVAVFVVGLIFSIPLGAISILSAINSKQLTPAFFSSLGGLGVVLLILLVVCMIISLAIQAATILIVANYKSSPSVPETIKKSFKFVLPLFLASLLMGFIVTGGYFLFIVPGILFQVFLYFTLYEIVLNKKGVIAAFRRSMGIVLANFWGVFGRIALWIVIVLAVSILPQIVVSSSKSSELGSIWSLVSFFINVFMSWYGISYAITLYRQAEKAAPENKTGKLLWPVIAAAVGWVVGILTVIGIAYAITTIVLPQIQKMSQTQNNLKKIQKMQLDENSTPEDFLNLFPTNSPERAKLKKQIEQEMMKNGGSMMNASVTPKTVK